MVGGQYWGYCSEECVTHYNKSEIQLQDEAISEGNQGSIPSTCLREAFKFANAQAFNFYFINKTMPNQYGQLEITPNI